MQPIVYVDTSVIRDRKIEPLREAMISLATFVETNVPQVISYAFYVDREQRTMTVVAVHPDSASLESHLSAGAAEFKKFAELIDLLRIDVYGRVSDAVRERLHQKAAMLGRGTVTVHDFHAGFAR